MRKLFLGAALSFALGSVALAAQPVTINSASNAHSATVDSNGDLHVAADAGATSTPPVTIQQTLTASAVQLASNALTNGAIFEIPSTNTGTVCVGAAGVTTFTGFCMSVASGITAGSLGVNNTNLIYVIGTNTSDKLFVLGN